ncbi:MAG TPA: hypothetical protein ENI06_11020 [Spirochaetales bacterium]|nr:hypothetical protein [Spirochaetales bacterium]
MIIKDTTLLSFAEFSIREKTDVLIEGNRITKIGEELCETEQLYSGHDVINGRGLYLIPGLVNAHAHTGMTLLRGAAEDVKVEDWFNKHIWIYEQNLTPDDVYFGTLLGAAEMLLSGGGRVLGLPGYGEIIEGAPADLVLIDPASPNMQPEHNVFANILYSLGERNIHTVIVDGKVVVSNGKLVNFPLAGGMAELYNEIAKIKNRITADRGGPMQSY